MPRCNFAASLEADHQTCVLHFYENNFSSALTAIAEEELVRDVCS